MNPPSAGSDGAALHRSSNRSSPATSGSGGSVETTTSVVGGVVSSVASLWKAWPWSK